MHLYLTYGYRGAASSYGLAISPSNLSLLNLFTGLTPRASRADWVHTEDRKLRGVSLPSKQTDELGNDVILLYQSVLRLFRETLRTSPGMNQHTIDRS